MTRDERETREFLRAAGWTTAELDEIERGRQPQPIRRTVDKRILDSALRLDLIDCRIEQARLERHQKTAATLRRLGFNVDDYRPAPVPRASERHLARAFASAEPTRHGTDKRGLLIRPNTGYVVAVH